LAVVVLAVEIEAEAEVLVGVLRDRSQFLLQPLTPLLLEQQGQVMEAHLLQVAMVVLLFLAR
jgi:hypothetical protein